MSFIPPPALPIADNEITLAMQLDAAQPVTVRMAAVDTTVRQAMPEILAYIRANVPDPQAREDLAQDTWADFAQAVRDGRFHNRGIVPRNYLMAMARRRIKHYYTYDPTQAHIEVPLPADELLDVLSAGDATTFTDLKSDFDTYFQQMLALLAEEDRALAQLWRAGYTVGDIAAATGRQYRSAWDMVQRLITLMRRVCPADLS